MNHFPSRRPLLWCLAGFTCLLALGVALTPPPRASAARATPLAWLASAARPAPHAAAAATPPASAVNATPAASAASATAPASVAARAVPQVAQLAAVKSPVADPTPAACSAGYVVLTLDDGPSPTYTNRMLDYLIQAQVPATFFVQGVRATAYPQPAQRAAGLGFTIGDHTWDHAHLPHLPDAQVANEIVKTRDALRRLGIDSGALMRAPYGETTPHDVELINRIGMTPVGWTDDSQDWMGGGPAEIAARVLAQLKPQGTNVVLMHDGIDGPDAHGRVVAAESLPALPAVVSGARQAGYCFTEFARNGQPMIPAPTWTDRGWAAR